MASIRIEAAKDPASGQVRAEFYAGDAEAPVLRSEPSFASEADMVEQIIRMCREHFPDHAPVSDDPTIGV